MDVPYGKIKNLLHVHPQPHSQLYKSGSDFREDICQTCQCRIPQLVKPLHYPLEEFYTVVGVVINTPIPLGHRSAFEPFDALA